MTLCRHLLPAILHALTALGELLKGALKLGLGMPLAARDAHYDRADGLTMPSGVNFKQV
jgi:hypothetical protein